MEYNKVMDSKQGKAYSAMNERPSMMDGRPPMMDGRPPMMDGRPPMMDGRPPMMDGRPPMMDGRPPMMDGRPPMMDGRPPMQQFPPMNNRPPMQPFPPMSFPPYPVYPPNVPMPFYYGEPFGNMMQWGGNEFTEEDLDRELAQVMELYPVAAQEIQKKVMEVCDAIDYDGSFIYDERPDKFVLSRYADKIYSEVVPEETEMEAESVEAQEVSGSRRPPCRNCHRRDGRRDLIDVLFFNEIFRRRCRHGRCHRW